MTAQINQTKTQDHKFRHVTPTRLVLLVSGFLILTGNWAFYGKLTDIYSLSDGNAVFIISITIFNYCVLLLLSFFLWLVIPARVAVSLLLLITAIVGYYADNLNIFIDINMIRNVLQTDVAEVADLANSGLIMRIVLLGIIPIALVWSLPFRKSGFLLELRYKLQVGATAMLIMVLCVFTLGNQYASFFREHKTVRKYTNPSYAIYSAGVYLKHALSTTALQSYTLLPSGAERLAIDTHPELVVLVVGETARADHFSLNGYERLTNPKLAAKDRLISYSEISSCDTSTAASLPCMFAHAGRASIDLDTAKQVENILDLLLRAGVHILWRDNNSGSKGIASRVPFQDFKSQKINPVCDIECRDVGMLDGLQNYIDSHPGDILIVLHQMGSHGPAYFKRYPQEFEQFTPACRSIELSSCSDAEIVNAYDNTILYTDYFLAEVIDFLERNTPSYETAMFYVSDHGESLGEGGFYLHGMPFSIAPAAQTHVPAIIWSGESSDIDYEKSLVLKNTPNTHDALFATLLDLFEIQTDLVSPAATPLVYLKAEEDH
jgi:lipid A ethanolaminephosphotransferase